MPRVLVVDDDRDIRALLCMALESEGFEVASAQDGDEALVFLLATEQPCVVLLDVNMPSRNGWEVCAALSDTSWTGKSHRVMLMSAGLTGSVKLTPIVRHVVRKPFHLAQLLQSIRALANEPDKPVDLTAGAAPTDS
jgi:CheY-like chemotaxis protein